MDIRQLLESRSARALDEDESGRVLVASDLTGTFQLYELDATRDGGELVPLTDFVEPVTGRYVPGTRHVVIAMDDGGNERHQLFLMDAAAPPLGDTSTLVPITQSPGHVHGLLGVRPDGRQIAFSSNRRNGVDFDVHTYDLDTGEVATVFDGGGWVQASSGYSPSGRYLAFSLPGPRPLDTDLCLADLETGAILRPLPHEDEAAFVGDPAWIADERCFVVSSNIGRDMAALVAHDLSSGTTSTVLEEEWDLDAVSSRDGSTLLAVANAGGASEASWYEVGRDADGHVTVNRLGAVALPGRGVIAGSLLTPPPILSRDGRHVTFTFTSPTVPGDVWRLQRGVAASQRLTASPGPDPANDRLVEPTVESLTSFDGEEVAVFTYRPQRSREPSLPVVLVVHGGPESQSMLTWNPVVQALVSRELGVVVPNVRGSTGYGKRFASLDDTTRRLDSVRDLAAIHSWLAGAGFDPERAALFGGSYGGYMVLAGVAFQSDLWAAGVDIVGISDLVTFLENTSAYRRSHREREYGSLTTDREFLEQASPLRRADEIRAPLFVIHGENDPRVPVSETRQLVASLERRGIPHELLVFDDEGHGLAKLKNRLVAYPKAVEFLEQHLGKD